MNRLSLAAATLLLAAPPAYAEAGAYYQKRVITVVERPGDPYAAKVREAFEAQGRFEVNRLAVGERDGQREIVAKVASYNGAARSAGTPSAIYAVVPRFSFGNTFSTSPQPERGTDGRVKAAGSNGVVTVYAEIRCPFTCTVDVLEVPSGRVVKTMRLGDELSRRVEYNYDKYTSDAALQYKAVEMGRMIGVEMSRRPAEAFASQAQDEARSIGLQLVGNLREMAEFKLQATVTGWDAERDRVLFNLGKELDVAPDDWFAILQDGNQVGILKVRALGDNRSEGQPLFLDGPLRVGDSVVELNRANVWHGLKSGAAALNTGTLGHVGYGLQWDIGPSFKLSELYWTLDLGAVTDFKATGFAGELGLVQRRFMRRWAWSYGAKVGILTGLPFLGQAVAPTGTLVTGLDLHLNDRLVWTNELGLQALWPLGSRTAGTVTYPFGPILRTGLTFAF